VPIPRRFDRRPPERDTTRINERIRVPEVRLIGDDGQQVGVVSRDEALKYAQSRDLDLVEVAAEARPPVVRVLDYSKYKYEQEQKAKAARKHQKQVTVREIKLRPKIAENDYETKKGHVVRFLEHSDRVKVTIMFRGRETTHPERGEQLLMRLADDVAELGTIEQRPSLDGRNMTMLLSPTHTREEGEHPSEDGDSAAPAEEGGSRRKRAARAKREQKQGSQPAPEQPPAAPPAEAAGGDSSA
jgi:translation initiation factor IF-3